MVGWCLYCDNFYSNLSGLRYAMAGGRLYHGDLAGPFYAYLGSLAGNGDWRVGACIVIISFVTFPVLAIPLSAVGSIMAQPADRSTLI